MTLRDLRNSTGASASIRPQVASAAVQGVTVDLRGTNSAFFLVDTGAIAGAGDFAFAPEESDNASDWTAIAAGDLTDAPPATLVADSTYRVGYAGTKRYVRSAITKAGGTSIAIAAPVVVGNPELAPIA